MDAVSAPAGGAAAPPARGAGPGVSYQAAASPGSTRTPLPRRGAGTRELPLGGRYVLTWVLDDTSRHAITYLADDGATGARVCLSWLRGDRAASPADIERYLRGVATLTSVRHPHVVALLDGGVAPDGRPYFVTEWLPGRPLRWFLAARGAVPLPYAAGALCQVLAGLGAAHQHGVIHRDVTPDHILVVPTADGAVVKLTGFGSAKSILAADGTATAWGVPAGTPGYGPPEQLRGQPIDGRADLFAVGVVFFEMLAGFPPYRGATAMDIARAILKDPIPELPGGVPAEARVAAATVLSRALAKLPAERFPTAQAMREALLPLAGQHAFGDFAGLDLDAPMDDGSAGGAEGGR
jgi:serine/threonine protein kinase